LKESLGASVAQEMFSEIVWKNRRKVPAATVRVEDRSTVEDRLPRNSCRQVCCVFVARAASVAKLYNLLPEWNVTQQVWSAGHNTVCVSSLQTQDHETRTCTSATLRCQHNYKAMLSGSNLATDLFSHIISEISECIYYVSMEELVCRSIVL